MKPSPHVVHEEESEREGSGGGLSDTASEGSEESDDEPAKGVTYGLAEEMRRTFFFMERRRQQRQASGRFLARGIPAALLEAAMFLGLSVYGLAFIRQGIVGPPRGNFKYLIVPVLLTCGVVGAAMFQSVRVPENLPAVWAKTWGWLLVIWILWLYNPEQSHGGRTGMSDLFSTPTEKAMLGIFVSLEVVTFLSWLVTTKLYPLVLGHCELPCTLRWFWRVRPAGNRPDWLSYRPNGCCCTPRRKHFQYDGDRNPEGQPQGHGVWRDDSYHGEVLEGEWRGGFPVAPFVSRAFGSGAISIGLRIGYGTARPEGLSGLSSWARRAAGATLRYGALGVECSVAGGFMVHLPQQLEHDEFASPAALVQELQGVAGSLASAINSMCRGTSLREMEAGLPLPLELPPPAARLAALVFIHGFNCPIDWACMRLAQLLALGKVNPGILPFVFSWPCGRILTYFDVLWHLDELATDLPRFIQELSCKAGIREVHLVAHSMGCELVTAALPQLEAIVASSRAEPDFRDGAAGPGGAPARDQQLRISTVTFFNATNPQRCFLAGGGQLQGLLRVGGRLTLYCDREDIAVRTLEVLTQRGRSIGRRGRPVGAPGSEESRRVDVVDCTSLDANVNGIRHSYFDLNAHVLGDFQELLTTKQPAARRSRLVRSAAEQDGNVFAFLAPPVFVNW